ncbi:hypothetical protein M2222_000652 [Bradyrhizobium elkanii]|nr:hypothetical protein [Bradyrhizobium elkanii]MCS3558330.1 hypothetical protein [Bradyrhizobium elkanii]MCW2151823.1 hypothetical protein [Bradyrhizobium elkanii]MCW2358304.1 hypothetical protein [Bradyrhizobium elkanii]MCW2375554.1 hypothetical protein [Bradyrhizobium elkanii]
MRLNRRGRVRAGCSIILAYLFCVLAPSFALAFGAPFPCLTDEVQPAAAAHVHAPSMPMAHAEAVTHDHAAHDHGGMQMHQAADDAAPPAKHSHDGKTASGPCCALMCVSALPADLPFVAAPLHPIATRLCEAHQSLRSEAPARLYRPPIA